MTIEDPAATPEDTAAYEAFAEATQAPIDAQAVGLDALAVAYADARKAREEVSDTEKRLREIEKRAEAALFEGLEARNLRSIRHKDLGLFTLSDIADAVVTDAAALREWAQEVMPELLSPNRQTLGKVIRDAMKEGEAIPPGTDYAFRRGINWRRG